MRKCKADTIIKRCFKCNKVIKDIEVCYSFDGDLMCNDCFESDYPLSNKL